MSAGVLVVDDIPVNYGLLEAKFSAEYYAVIAVGSGAEALEIIQNRTPDIVFLNVMMPEMDGFEVCRRIKANPLTALLPVIMVAALIDQLQGKNLEERLEAAKKLTGFGAAAAAAGVRTSAEGQAG